MNVRTLAGELDLLDESAVLYVEVGDVCLPITGIMEDSQGVTLVVDPDLDEREMR